MRVQIDPIFYDPMPNPSAETVITLARGLMREDAGSDVPSLTETVMLQSCAAADREALRAYRKGAGNTPVALALEFGPTLASDTQVNNSSGVLTTDVTLTVDSTSGFDAAGAAVLWTKTMPDVFFYTSLTSTVFSGVTGIGSPHGDNDKVQALYALPSNFGGFRQAEGYGDGVQLNGDGLTYMDGNPTQGHFSMRDDGTTKYLWLPVGSSGDVSVLFDKDSNTIDSMDDLVSLPEDWLHFYAWRTIAISLFGRGDYSIIPIADENARKEKLDLLMDRKIGRAVRVRQYGGLRNDWDSTLAFRENAL